MAGSVNVFALGCEWTDGRSPRFLGLNSQMMLRNHITFPNLLLTLSTFHLFYSSWDFQMLEKEANWLSVHRWIRNWAACNDVSLYIRQLPLIIDFRTAVRASLSLLFVLKQFNSSKAKRVYNNMKPNSFIYLRGCYKNMFYDFAKLIKLWFVCHNSGQYKLEQFLEILCKNWSFNG